MPVEESIKIQYRWASYTIIGLITLCSGMLRNAEGRKYIPIIPDAIPLRSCEKVYANVYALSQTETGGLICCDGFNIRKGLLETFSYEGLLCSQKIKPLPLTKSITRLPDLLILTFLPVLFRLFISFYGWRTRDNSAHRDGIIKSINRSILYIFIMLFRGYVLYNYLNRLEDTFSTTISVWLRMATSRFSSEMVDNPECWYDQFLMKHNAGSCYGQQFDFSDHVVLFLAQSLPIMLFEATICQLFPLWPTQKAGESNVDLQVTSGVVPNLLFNTVLSNCLSFFFLYMNFITLLAMYSTTAYFHTNSEVFTAFVISLVVQIPLALLMTSTRWPNLRLFFGLLSAEVSTDRDHSD